MRQLIFAVGAILLVVALALLDKMARRSGAGSSPSIVAVTDRVMGSDGTRNQALTLYLAKSNEPCGEVVRSIKVETGSPTLVRWEAICSDRNRYVIWMDPSYRQTRYIPCAEIAAIWRRLKQGAEMDCTIQ